MASSLPESVAAVEALLPVSRETRERLAHYVSLLIKWQRSQNLIAPATLRHIWTRHMADSVQAHLAAPQASRWVDLGSGAGFPGLVTAILLADRPGAQVDLVESNSGKVAFLRTVARETGAPARVHAERIEAFTVRWTEPVDAVSARALAAFDGLLGLAGPLLARGALGVFHKGQDFASELRLATQSWDVDLVEQPSRTETGGRIVIVRRFAPLARHGVSPR